MAIRRNKAGTIQPTYMSSRGFPGARLVALDLKDNADTESLNGGLGLIRWGAGWPPKKGIGAIPGLKQCSWNRAPQHSGRGG